MAKSFGRACHACRIAKRRCNPQLPKCDRCSRKQIDCSYDLEPVTRIDHPGIHQHQDLPSSDIANTTNPQSSVQSPVPKFVYGSASAAFEAVVSQTGYPSTAHLSQSALYDDGLLSHWISVLKGSTSDKPSPFLHTSVLSHTILPSAHNRTQGPQPPPSSRDLYTKHRYDRQLEDISLQEQLLTIHGLYSFIMEHIINLNQSTSGDNVRTGLIDQYFSWVNTLWSSGPDQLKDSPFTPWETWCLAESVRRALLSAYTIRSIFDACTQGYTNYIAFVETLPFDPREDLWKAQTESEWLDAVAKHGGQETELVSWRELVSQPGSKLKADWDGPLQRMLFTGYHGLQVMGDFP